MEKDKRKKHSSYRLWYFAAFVIIILIAYKLLDSFGIISSGGLEKFLKVLMPFISGIIIAFLFYIPCKKIEELIKKVKILKKPARILSILVVYLIAIGLIVILINIVFPAISKSLVELGNSLPGYYKSAMEYVENMDDNSLVNKDDIKNIINNLQQIDIVEMFSLDNVINYIKGAVGVASTIFNIFVTIIVSIYILAERTRIVNFVQRLNKAIFKEETSKKANEYFIKANNVFLKFVSSQILDGVIVGIVVSIALAIMKVKYAILLGFLIGLFNIIPFFGSIVAISIAGLITLFTGGFTKTIWMLIVTIILQQIDANIINPRIVGKALKISPLLVIFSVTLFGAYFGVIGMFLAVPITAVIKMIVDEYIENKNKEKKNA